MNASLAVRFVVAVCLLGALLTHVFAGESSDLPASTVKIVVDGRTLTGPQSTATVADGRALLPLTAIARALGATAAGDAQVHTVTVRRANGIVAVFDAALGQVSENGAAVLTVANSRSLVIAPNADDIVLPSEIVASLLDVSVRFDVKRNAIVIESGPHSEPPAATASASGFLDIYRVDSEYNLTRYTTASSADMLLTSVGRVGDGRFFLRANMAGSASQPRFVNGSLDITRPNGQRFVAGDLGTGGRLEFLSTMLRGAMATIPFSGTTLNAFAGKAASGNVLLLTDASAPTRPFSRFDTTVFGASASTQLTRSLLISGGTMRFSGPQGDGSIAAASANYDGSRLRFTADVADGSFAKGAAAAVDVSATYQAADSLSFQARYAHIGRNFLSPQTAGHEPIDLRAGGMTWNPRKWLNASINASTARRPGATADGFVTTSIGITPGAGRTRFSLSHTESRSLLIKKGEFTLLNAATEWRRIHFFATATRVKTIGAANLSAQLGAAYSLSDVHQIELSQAFGSRGMMNGQVDWRSSMFAGRGLSFSAGLGYDRTASTPLRLDQRLTASLRLPRESSVSLNYVRTSTGTTMVVQIKATLFKKREAAAYLGSSPGQAVKLGGVAGRVFQDMDGDGRYDATVDRPQAGVTVRIDGSRYAVTDANGTYVLAALPAGEHKLTLDLTSVRADLTMTDGGARQIEITGGRTQGDDFVLVRTGRIAGRVFIDANGNGKFDDGEQALANIRVVTSSGRDPLTDEDGSFSIADLAPGEHAVLIDEKTLPERFVAAAGTLHVRVLESRETGGVWLAVIPAPTEVKRFTRTGN